MKGLCCLSVLFVQLVLASSSPLTVSRRLEDVQDGENAQQDMSSYTLRTGTCFRSKIQNDNDDDGNVYFYNGAYRAQYHRYISYELCSENYGCHKYVSEVEDFLESTVEFVQNYCTSCANTCRRLEEQQQQEGQVAANCNSCKDQCSAMQNNNGSTDAANYIQCQAGANNGDVQYYTAPQCEDGKLVIGHFYDDECTIKTQSMVDEGYSYATFRTIESMYIDCSLSDVCADLAEEAVFCDQGYAEDEEDSRLCKAAEQAARVQTYYKKPFIEKIPIGLIIFLFLALGVLFGFLSYTYYVRHIRHKEKKPMAEQEGGPELPPVT
jgi:hypothetical protein